MRRLISFLLLATAATGPIAAQVRDTPDQRPPRGDRNGDRGDRGDRVAGAPGQGWQNAQPGLPAGERFGGAGGFDRPRSDPRDQDRRFGREDARPGDGGRYRGPDGLARRGDGPGDRFDGRQDDGRNDRFGARRPGGPDRDFDPRTGNRPDRFGDRPRYGAGGRFDPRPGAGANGYPGRPVYGGTYGGRPDLSIRGRYDGRNGWNGGWRDDRRYDWQGYRAANRNLFRAPRYYGPRGYDYSRWSRGYRVQPFFYGRNYWISDPWRYRLPPADGYYRWVRYYDDVALIDIRSGLIEDIIYSFFWR